MATCPTFSWGRGSICHIGRQLYWKRKNLRLLISFSFWAPVTEEERKRQRSKRRINAEERRRRKNWKRERVDRVFIRKGNEYWGEIIIKIRNFVL